MRIEDELWRKVKALAALEGTTMSALLKEMLIALVRGAKKAAKPPRAHLNSSRQVRASPPLLPQRI